MRCFFKYAFSNGFLLNPFFVGQDLIFIHCVVSCWFMLITNTNYAGPHQTGKESTWKATMAEQFLQIFLCILYF